MTHFLFLAACVGLPGPTTQAIAVEAELIELEALHPFWACSTANCGPPRAPRAPMFSSLGRVGVRVRVRMEKVRVCVCDRMCACARARACQRE